MKLSKYIKALQRIEEIQGGNLKIVFANHKATSFKPVGYWPSIGHYSTDLGIFTAPNLFEDGDHVNAVCIN